MVHDLAVGNLSEQLLGGRPEKAVTHEQAVIPLDLLPLRDVLPGNGSGLRRVMGLLSACLPSFSRLPLGDGLGLGEDAISVCVRLGKTFK